MEGQQYRWALYGSLLLAGAMGGRGSVAAVTKGSLFQLPLPYFPMPWGSRARNGWAVRLQGPKWLRCCTAGCYKIKCVLHAAVKLRQEEKVYQCIMALRG